MQTEKNQGNGNQNSLQVNGEDYPVQNGQLYEISGDDLWVNLYNLQSGNNNGRSMGKWWLDDISCSTNCEVNEV